VSFWAELRTQFGLSQAQVKQMTNVWGGLFVTYQDELYTALPSLSDYQNTMGS